MDDAGEEAPRTCRIALGATGFLMRGLPVERLVFRDETGATTKTTRLRNRAPRGQRLLAKVPHGHWKTTTFLASLRTTGLVAPLVLDGPINGELFLAYVRQQLFPTLAQGDVFVMDNLPAHKVQGVRQAIEHVGARVRYLVAYSPDLNLNEQVFAKLKALLRKAAKLTLDEPCQAIAHAVEGFTPRECRNYIRNSGYARGI